MSEWQPIETAPKDGTQILGLFSKKRRAVIAWYNNVFYSDGWYFPLPQIGGTGYDTAYRVIFPEDEPIGWQKLPE